MHMLCIAACANYVFHRLTCSTALQYTSAQDEHAGQAGQSITIGGPSNVTSRFQPRNNGNRQMAAATQVHGYLD